MQANHRPHKQALDNLPVTYKFVRIMLARHITHILYTLYTYYTITFKRVAFRIIHNAIILYICFVRFHTHTSHKFCITCVNYKQKTYIHTINYLYLVLTQQQQSSKTMRWSLASDKQNVAKSIHIKKRVKWITNFLTLRICSIWSSYFISTQHPPRNPPKRSLIYFN